METILQQVRNSYRSYRKFIADIRYNVAIHQVNIASFRTTRVMNISVSFTKKALPSIQIPEKYLHSIYELV